MAREEEICGIIVTYNPDKTNLDVIRDNCLVLRKIIIYDNSTNNCYYEKLTQIIQNIQSLNNEHRKIIIIHRGQNIGLSGAYNSSVRLAEEIGCKFVIFLDQDSLITFRDLLILIRDYNSLLEKGIRVGAISMHNEEIFHTPISIFFDGKFRWRKFYYSDNIQEKRNLINSGMLISIKNFDLMNGYNESFFVANTDLEFTLRLRIRKLRLFESGDAKIMVNYKETTHNYKIAALPYRKPEREYFIRDLIRCLPLALELSKIDALLIILLIIAKLFGILLFKDKKKERFAFILSGIKDGLGFLMIPKNVK